MEPQEVAAQLRKPTGDDGIFIADNLNTTNLHLTTYVYDQMHVLNGQHILELGFGNGKLMDILFAKGDEVQVSGIDFSETMVKAAAMYHKDRIASGRLTLQCANLKEIPYPNNTFDKICNINTLYFWEDPAACTQELWRVLKPEGKVYTGIRSRTSMEQMPFTKHGFTLYHPEDAASLFRAAGFKMVSITEQDDPPIEFNEEVLHLRSICIIAEK